MSTLAFERKLALERLAAAPLGAAFLTQLAHGPARLYVALRRDQARKLRMA